MKNIFLTVKSKDWTTISDYIWWTTLSRSSDAKRCLTPKKCSTLLWYYAVSDSSSSHTSNTTTKFSTQLDNTHTRVHTQGAHCTIVLKTAEAKLTDRKDVHQTITGAKCIFCIHTRADAHTAILWVKEVLHSWINGNFETSTRFPGTSSLLNQIPKCVISTHGLWSYNKK